MTTELLIVVDTLFHRRIGSQSDPEGIEIGEDKLLLSTADLYMAKRKAVPVTWPKLKDKLVAAINSHQHLNAVWVIGHMECFDEILGDDKLGGVFQRRITSAEAYLRTRIDEKIDLIAREPARVEVFGFHHIDGSTIWHELSSFERTELAKSYQNIIRSLEGMNHENIFSRFSVLKHQLMKIFLPLDLSLQDWAETRSTDDIPAQVLAKLGEKIRESKQLMLELESVIRNSGRTPDLKPLADILNYESASRSVQTSSFHTWIGDLDFMLDEMRKALVT